MRRLECSEGLCPVRAWCSNTLASEPILVARLEQKLGSTMIGGVFLELMHEEYRGKPTVTEDSGDPEVLYRAAREYWNPDRATEQLHRAQGRLQVARAIAPLVSQDCDNGVAVQLAQPPDTIIELQCGGEVPDELRAEQAIIAAAQATFLNAKREAIQSGSPAPDPFNYGL